MAGKLQSLAIRLLREGREPASAVREGVVLADWSRIDGAKIVLGSLGGRTPRWADFLDLDGDERARLRQESCFAVVFVCTAGRWFACTFGLGYSRLEPNAFEQDFGLRVVLNAVDPKRLRSTDLRTPDDNTLTRRAQTSRRSDQQAFSIDAERDIVRGLMGEPKDQNFASVVSGSDGVTLRRKATIDELPGICAEVYAMALRKDYVNDFGWVDQIRHERDPATLVALEHDLVNAFSNGLRTSATDDLHLAYPVLYDPDKIHWIRFRGYGGRRWYPDLDLAHYFEDLRDRDIFAYDKEFLHEHKIEECDEDGQSVGNQWRLMDCVVYETELNGRKYVLSGGKWYCVSQELADEVSRFFESIEQTTLPPAHAGENEDKYIERISSETTDMVCLDSKLLRPSGAGTDIEICDFFSAQRSFIHIKDKNSSSRLSHLFNQGLVSARTLRRDTDLRRRLRELVKNEANGADLVDLLPGENSFRNTSDYTVVFGVLVNQPRSGGPRLPFFSLVTFRQVARQLRDELGFKVAFAWVVKAGVAAGKTAQRKSQGGTSTRGRPTQKPGGSN